MADDGIVQITLKDVYQQQQALERSLGDTLNTLNLTMIQIKGHIERLDARNSAADELSREQGERISKVEAILIEAQPIKSHESIVVRVNSLERFKYLLLGALVLINGIGIYVEQVILHH